jgi:hypothetical protein
MKLVCLAYSSINVEDFAVFMGMSVADAKQGEISKVSSRLLVNTTQKNNVNNLGVGWGVVDLFFKHFELVHDVDCFHNRHAIFQICKDDCLNFWSYGE